MRITYRLKSLLVVLFPILVLMPVVLSSQVKTGSFNFEGINRSYVLFLPRNYDGITKMPVVFNLHGATMTGQFQMEVTYMNIAADSSGFIAVYPTGIAGLWNYGEGSGSNVNDVGFINALIDTLIAHYAIDPEMIYSCGLSMGGDMSFTLACKLNKRIAAIASIAGALPDMNDCDTSIRHFMAVMLIHGTSDTYVLYNGSDEYPSVDQNLKYWIDYNNCTESDTIPLPDLDSTDNCTVDKIIYKNSSNNVSVILFKVNNGGHTWPGADKIWVSLLGNITWDINANSEIWKFFKDYKLSQFITSIRNNSQIANKFSLSQNYPNPFNPSTSIEYRVGSTEWVTLKVYDILGIEVATLVNEEKPAGTYEVTWDAENLSSGVYFYQLTAGEFVQTKKLILLR